MKKILLLLAMALFIILPATAYAEEDPIRKIEHGQPRDVVDFIERQAMCNHWSGEEPYDGARIKQIVDAEVKLNCEALESDEASLRKKYIRHSKVESALDKARDLD